MYKDQEGNEVTDDQLHDHYDEMLDDAFGMLDVAGIEMHTSTVLYRVDPIAYRVGFSEWLDSEVTEGAYTEED